MSLPIIQTLIFLIDHPRAQGWTSSPGAGWTITVRLHGPGLEEARIVLLYAIATYHESAVLELSNADMNTINSLLFTDCCHAYCYFQRGYRLGSDSRLQIMFQDKEIFSTKRFSFKIDHIEIFIEVILFVMSKMMIIFCSSFCFYLHIAAWIWIWYQTLTHCIIVNY